MVIYFDRGFLPLKGGTDCLNACLKWKQSRRPVYVPEPCSVACTLSLQGEPLLGRGVEVGGPEYLASEQSWAHVAVFWGAGWRPSLGDVCHVHARRRRSLNFDCGVCDSCGPRDLGQ